MKAIKMMMFVAAAMLFAACGKDDAELDDNTLVYGGVTYQMDQSQAVVDYYHNELTLLTVPSVEKEGDEAKITFERFHLRPESWNKTIDLVNMKEDDFYELAFTGTVLNMLAFGQKTVGEQYFSGVIDGQQYENTTVFESGSLTVKGNNDGTPITVILDSRLKNGKELRMKVVSPSYEVR